MKLPPRPAEARALETACNTPASRVLSTTLGRAQAAIALAEQRPAAHVVCWFLDQFQLQLSTTPDAPPNLALVCQPDLPTHEVDLAVIPTSMNGEVEFTRDLLQSAADRLALGGTLVTATDNPRDTWLHAQLACWFDKVTTHRHDDATVYTAVKRRPLRKLKNFRCEFAFRDGQRLVRAISRPGVFSHRHADPGARQLLAAADVWPGMQILDIGCGAGTVALALAAREPTASVHAVDSNARAVECTLVGAALNSLDNVTVELNAQGDYQEPGTFDLALANPPYYSDFAIAERFLAAARRSLRPGGRLLVVTKHPQWYEETLPAQWREVAVSPSRQYWMVSAVL